MSDSRAGFRLKILVVLVVVMFAALTTRLWYLQVLASDQYRTEALQNRLREIKTPAPRGWILDRNGNVIVKSRSSLEVTVDRQHLANRDETVRNLSRLLGMPVDGVNKAIDDKRYYPFAPVPIAFDVSPDVVAAISEHGTQMFPGVSWQETSARDYPLGDMGAHLLGHIGQIQDTQIHEPQFAGYDPNDIVGQGGLEAQYETDLQGTKGTKSVRVDAQGTVQGNLGYKRPVPGNNLVLALDADLQKMTEDKLQQGIDRAQKAGWAATSAAAVVLDPNTGEVVAMASIPTYDPTIFDGGLTHREASELEIGRKHSHVAPQIDRATSGEYPAGSTFKPFIGLAALKEGLATENTQFDCTSELTISKGETFKNWDPTDQGMMTIAQALPPSCDTVFYRIGYYDFWPKFYKEGYLQDPSIHGPETLQKDLTNDFGFGAHTGIDLPFGSPGNIPTEAWKNDHFSQLYKDNSRNFCTLNMCPGDFIHMAIGQGDVRVTPLQLARGYAAIDSGQLCTPHVGLRIESPDGKTVRNIPPDCQPLKGYSDGDLRYIRAALGQVVTSGTAAPAFAGFPLSQVSVAGKTGTAEVTGQGQDNSWFAAMTHGTVKGDAKNYVVVVMVERGGHGAETAAPIARQIIEGLYGLKASNTWTGQAAD